MSFPEMPYDDEHFSSEFHDYWSRNTDSREQGPTTDSKFKEAADIKELRQMTKDAWADEKKDDLDEKVAKEEMNEIIGSEDDSPSIDATVEEKSWSDGGHLILMVLIVLLVVAAGYITITNYTNSLKHRRD